ncbi:MAG: DUF6056 family protein, partial [Bdellovibrionaceae bacterium]|nr:DUF6056 family protein [Pseudobdellovibrionaceae bacterium]
YRWGLRWHRSGGEAHRPRWPHFSEVIVFLALLAGTAFLVFAPGNYVRLQATQPMGAPGLLERIDWFVQSLLVFFGRPDGVVYLVGVFVLFRFCRAVDFRRRLVSDPVASSLAVWFILSLITYFGHDGNFYGRKSYHNSLIFVALIVRVASLHLPVEKENLKNVARVVVGLVALAILRLGFDTYKVWSFALQMERREKEILASTEELITTYQIESAFDLDDLSADPKNWVNESYARFLGVRAIRALPREEIK